MRHLYRVFVLVLLALSPALMSRAAQAADAPKDAWPDTHAGVMARGWVTAFDSGEASMHAFIDQNMAAKSLHERDVHVRVERYKTLRGQYGKLQLAAVVKSTPAELTVQLMDSDAKSHEFTFAVQSEAPYKLTTVSIREAMHGMHGLFSGFHH